MPYLLDKHSPTISVVTFKGFLTLDDLINLNNEVDEYVNNQTDEHCVIYLINEVEKFPQNISKVMKASTPISTNKLITYQIMVGIENPIFKFLVNIITSLSKIKVARAQSLEEALALLQGHQTSS